MSDVGLGANLELSIADALRRVDQLGSALARASEVHVVADTAQVTPAITAAVERARTEVLVTADGAPLTASVSSAVEAANTAVLVTGDASQLTGAVTGAVEAADTTVTVTGDASQLAGEVDSALQESSPFGPVSITGGVDSGLQTDVLNLGANLADASDEGRGLQKVLGALTVGAAAKGLLSLATAASDAEQAAGGVEAVFGAAANVIDRFASQSAQAAGIASTSARTLTSQIGGLLQGFDFTQQEAAETSVVIAQLGADLAATFGGRPEEAVQALGGALRGEFNPLERFGVSLNIAQINAFALERGMANSTAEIDLATRAQAALTLIMERTANAQGQFGRESETAAGALAIAQAQAKNLATEAGQHLTPAFLTLVGVVSREVLPTLAEAGDEVLPAISDAIVNLAPLLGSTTSLFVALAPVVELVANVLAAIPDEAIAIGASLIVANKALGTLGGITNGLIPALKLVPGILTGITSAVPAATGGVGSLAGGITGLAQGVATLNPYVVLGTAVLGGFAGAAIQAAAEKRRFREEVDQVTQALIDENGQLRITTSGLADYIENASRFDTKNQADDLERLGLTAEEVAARLREGGDGFDDFVDRAVRFGEVTELTRNSLGQLVDAQGKVLSAAGSMTTALGQAEEINGRIFVGNADLIKSYEELASVTTAAARAEVEGIVASGRASQGALDQAVALNTLADGTIDYIGVLETLGPKLDRADAAFARSQSRYTQIVANYLTVADALRQVRDEAPAVESAISAVRLGGVDTERGLLNVAVALDKASLSEEGFAAAAAALGTDVEGLQGFIDLATGALDEFVDAAVQGLPTVASVFDKTLSAANQVASDTAEQIRTLAQDRAKAIRDAASDAVASAGESITTGDAQRIRDQADEQAQAIIDAAQTEADAIAESGRITAGALTQQLLDTATEVADFRSDLTKITDAGFADVAALLARQSAETGNQLADELSASLDAGNRVLLENLSAANTVFEDETQATIDYMRDVLGPELILTSGLVGQGASDALFEGMDFKERMRIQGELAGLELSEQGKVIAVIAATEGNEAARSYGRNLGLDDETIAAGIAAGEAIRNTDSRPWSETGVRLGTALTDGVDAAFRAASADEAERYVEMLEARARAAADAQSPSRVWAALGDDLGAGLRVGLDRSGSEVIAAAEAIVRDAADAIARVSPDVTASITGTTSAGGGSAIPDELIRALEAIASNGPGVSITATGTDLRSTLRDAVTEARAIARGGI